MVAVVPNIAKGKVAYLAGLPAANDALIAVPIHTTSVPTAEQFRDADTLAALLAIGTENTTMTRKTLASVTVNVDDTANEVWVDSDNLSYTSGQMAAAGGAVSKLVICYDPDTTGGTDSALIPLVALDMVVTPDDNAFEYQFGATGWYAATE